MAVPRQDTVTLELAPALRYKLLCGGHQSVAALAGFRPQDLQAGASVRPLNPETLYSKFPAQQNLAHRLDGRHDPCPSSGALKP